MAKPRTQCGDFFTAIDEIRVFLPSDLGMGGECLRKL